MGLDGLGFLLGHAMQASICSNWSAGHVQTEITSFSLAPHHVFRLALSHKAGTAVWVSLLPVLP